MLECGRYKKYQKVVKQKGGRDGGEGEEVRGLGKSFFEVADKVRA